MVYEYNRERAVSYARRWALSDNPCYGSFADIGGDCTAFVSQCLFAGSGVMNFTPEYGWYYVSLSDRTPAWSGVEYLYNFLTTNTERAVFGHEADISETMPGDVIQLQNESGDFYHTVIVTSTGRIPSPQNILVASHSYNALDKILRRYPYYAFRVIHIDGYYA